LTVYCGGSKYLRESIELMKKALFIIVLGLFLAAFEACKQEAAKPLGPEISVGIEASPSTLDPRLARDAYAVQIMPLVFPGLFKNGKTLEPEPDLVSSYEQQGDRSYVFHIRQGVRFANGKELVAEDVRATIESLNVPDLNSPYIELAERVAKIEIMDKYSLKLELKEPYSPLLVELNLGILPAELARKKTQLETNELIGAGPYRITKWVPGTEITLSRNESYIGPKPYFEKINFRIIPEDITRLMSLEKGEIQLVQTPIPPDELERLKANPRLKVIAQPGTNYTYMGFNLRDPVLAKPLVRQAIAYAINRDEIVKCLLKKSASKADTLLSPRHWAYEPDVKKYEYNPELAKKLLDQAGYPARGTQGPSRFKLSYKTSQNQLRLWIAQAIANQLGKVGIDVEVRSLEFGTLFSDIQAGNFQIFTLTWVGVVEPDIFYTVFDSQSIPPKGANRGYYSNPEIDRLVTDARAAQDRSERKALYSEVQKILATDLPYVSLWYSTDIAVCDQRLEGFELGAGGEWTSLAAARWRR